MWSLQSAQPLEAVTVQVLPYHLLGIVITPRSISLWGEGREKKKKKPFVLRFGGELLEGELKDKDSILLHNNKGLMDKIPKNYKLIKFRAVLGGEMKGKMRPFEKRRRAVRGGVLSEK